MTANAEHTIHWIGLASIPGVGRVTFRKLVAHFGSPFLALGASFDELRQVPGVPEKVLHAVRDHPWRPFAEDELARADRSGITVMTAADDGYPKLLLATPDPPLMLYIQGRLPPPDRRAVAVVGTRTPTHYGRAVTQRMCRDLARSGHVVVSGMARGIDTEAHLGCLDAGGRTIAVLGSGIDVPYPPENRDLMQRIASNGAVVTENPFGTKPESGYFPARNRIISGLASGTIIVEASEDSGSLITADYALKQGRKLFAVPGNVGSPVSRGPNSLIKQGAVLVESAADVFRQLGGAGSGSREMPLPPLAPEEASVIRTLTAEPKHIDALLAECGAAPGRLGGILTGLELKGLVKQLPGKYFVRASL